MKIGIYIHGLGETAGQQSVSDYATRLKNELDSHTKGITHDLKVGKINYTTERQSNVVSIIKKEGDQEIVVYKLYDFKYSEILTKSFNRRNILLKGILLLNVVINKTPIIFKRFFVQKNYNRPFQTFYVFLLFFLIAAAILFMLPATLSIIGNFLFKTEVVTFVHRHAWLLAVAHFFGINHQSFKLFSELFLSITSILLLLYPTPTLLLQAWQPSLFVLITSCNMVSKSQIFWATLIACSSILLNMKMMRLYIFIPTVLAVL